MHRRSLIWLVAPLVVPAASAPERPIVVVTMVGVTAYTQTAQGLHEQIPYLQLLDVRSETSLRDRLQQPHLALAIAVGSDAAAAVDRLAPPHLPVIRTDLLQYDAEHGSGAPRPGATITVDVQPSALFSELERVFPGKTRIGIIRGPLQTDSYMQAVEQAARQHRFAVEVRYCAEARELVGAFLDMKNRVDFVWCPPSPQLYNSATLKPLLIASLTNRLPILGFSEQFAEAGALFAGVADFRDVGHQTADLARRVLQGESVASRQEARKFRFVYNQRVARLLGVKAAVAGQPGEELAVIQ